MADNDIVRRGYLNVVQKPKGGVIGRVLSVTSRRHWVVLRRESSGYSNRIELYRSEDQSGEPLRTINLTARNVRNVNTMDRKKAFVLVLQDESIMYQCSSRAEMDDWYRDLQYYVGSHRSGGGGVSSPTSTTLTGGAGDIYEIIPDDETYHVRLRKAKSLAFSGPCLLEIMRDFERNLFHIALFTEEDVPRLVVKWQIDHVRQYGSNNMAFKFESGTKSSTGVDWFIVDTEPGYAVKVHRAVDYWAKHIVEQVKNLPSTPPGRSTPRRSTLPGNSSIPDNACMSNSMPHNGRVSIGGVTPTSPGDGGGVYMPLHQGSLAAASVYATPDSTAPYKPGIRGKKPAPQLPADTSNSSTYMALNPNSMNSTQNQTYEGIYPRTVASERPGRATNGSNPNQLYMGIDPRTKNVEDTGQYMGLKESRS